MSNEYYTPSGVPANNSTLSSSAMRGEVNLIESGFDKLPIMAGNGGKVIGVNSGGTALEVITAVPHEQGGIEADISAIANGGILVGTGSGTMAVRASALTDGASGVLKHELGGIEANISAIANGGILVGTGAGTMAIRASALTDGASGYFNLAVGGLGFNASSIVGGDFIVGVGAGIAGFASGQSALNLLEIVSKYTTSTTSRSSTTTLADDPYLAGWSLDADSIYKVEGFLIISSTNYTAGGFKLSIQIDQSPQTSYFILNNATTAFGANVAHTVLISSDAEIFGYRVSGTIHTHPTNVSVLDFQWAQSISNVAPAIVYNGSWITVEKLGTA